MSSRGFPVTKQMRAEKRAQAEQRQEEYNKLSLAEKLAKLPKDGATKQRKKLQALLNQQNNKQEVK